MSAPAEGASSRPFPVGGLRRRWKSIVVLGALGLLLGSLLLLVLPVKYTSTVSLIIEPSLGNAFAPTDAGQSLDNVTSEVVVASSTPVAEKVRKATGTELSTKQLRKLVEVDKVPNSQVLQMQVTAESADDARTLAASFAKSYLDYRQEVSVEATEDLLSGLETSAANARSAIDLSVTKLAATKAGTQAYELAQSRVRSASATLTELETQADQVRFSQSQPGRVLSPATRPRNAGRGYVLPAGGLIVGLLVGLALATRAALRDDRIYDAEDLTSVGPPLLSPLSLAGLHTRSGKRSEARLFAASFRARLGPDRSAVVLTAVGPGVDVPRGALALAEALRASAVDAAIVELSADAYLDEHPAAGDDDATFGRPGGPFGSGSEAGVQTQEQHDEVLSSDAPVYRLRGDRLDGAQFAELVERLRVRHELVLVVGKTLTDATTLDAIETVEDTMLIVPLRRHRESAVRSAVDQVRLFHGRVIALIAG